MPTYLYENFGHGPRGAGFHSMFYTHLFAFVGVLLAGRLSDKLGSLHPRGAWPCRASDCWPAVPVIVLMGNSATLWVIYIGFAGFGFAVRSSTPTPTRCFTTSSRPGTTPRLRA